MFYTKIGPGWGNIRVQTCMRECCRAGTIMLKCYCKFIWLSDCLFIAAAVTPSCHESETSQNNITLKQIPRGGVPGGCAPGVMSPARLHFDPLRYGGRRRGRSPRELSPDGDGTESTETSRLSVGGHSVGTRGSSQIRPGSDLYIEWGETREDSRKRHIPCGTATVVRQVSVLGPADEPIKRKKEVVIERIGLPPEHVHTGRSAFSAGSERFACPPGVRTLVRTFLRCVLGCVLPSRWNLVCQPANG